MHHSSHNSEKWIHTRYEFYKNFSTDKNSWKCSFVQHSSQSQSRRFTAAWMIMNLGMLHHLMVIDQFTGASELWQLYGVVGIQLFFLKKLRENGLQIKPGIQVLNSRLGTFLFKKKKKLWKIMESAQLVLVDSLISDS